MKFPVKYLRIISEALNNMKDDSKEWHTHHVIPRYLGGGDNWENLIVVTLEQHIALHEALYEAWGNLEDLGAVRLLRYGPSDPRTREITSKLGAAATMRKKAGIHGWSNEKRRANLDKARTYLTRGGIDSRTAASHTPEALDKLAATKSKWILSDGENEFQSAREAAAFHGITRNAATHRAREGIYGWSRRLKRATL